MIHRPLSHGCINLPRMRVALVLLVLLGVVQAPAAVAQDQPITIRAARVIDGKGQLRRQATVEVRGSKIVAIDQRQGPVTYDLGDRTLLPGLIDVHVHIGYHFRNGRADTRGETPAEAAYYAAENAWTTLMNGFTTVQSVGAASDKELRDAIARGVLPGPRLLTSLNPMDARTGDPEAIRAYVRKTREDGADLIKIFASKSIREGGAKTLSDDQLAAACGEAKAVGLRTLVHAHAADAVLSAAKAGCTEIEHGAFVDDETLKYLADHGVYFDPNIGLVLQNYLENKAKFLGIGNYTDEGFAFMEKAIPTNYPMFKRALASGVKMPLGTDAVAGAHGQNARELIVRVQEGGQQPMDALTSATSLAAESLRLQDTIGTIAPGLEADLIAVEGDPLQDITTLRRVTFVMRAGRIYKR
jgi:imidazolonepropionase-like amidohydrolase